MVQALKQELMYAMHLNVPSVLIELKGLNCVNLARIVSEHLLQSLSHLVGHLISSANCLSCLSVCPESEGIGCSSLRLLLIFIGMTAMLSEAALFLVCAKTEKMASRNWCSLRGIYVRWSVEVMKFW